MIERPTERCRFCGHEGPQLVSLETSGQHYARVACAECNRFMRWLPKPDSDPTKYKRQKKHTGLVGKYGQGFCEMCLRKEGDLPKGQGLEAQHVQEYAEGGSEERGNIWIICTPCHKLIHWLRTYHGGEHVQPVVGEVAASLQT
jgi:hypothetical protein